MSTVLRLEGVGFEAGGQSLLGPLDLSVRSGRRVLVLGPNGAGKSLLLRIAHGLLAPSRGRVVANGGGDGQRQAMVFQHAVPMRRSVHADIEFALGCSGVARGARRERAREALDVFGLAALSARPARVLSGGERQRLALARAWALQPRLLFLDEPTAALDPRATREVEAALSRFHAAGTAIVMSSHDLGQARRLADEVVFLHRGQVLEHTPADTFFQTPRSEAAAAFVQGELLW